MVTPHELLNFFRVVRLDDKFVDGSAFILQRDNYGICLSYNMGGTLSIGGSKISITSLMVFATINNLSIMMVAISFQVSGRL